MSFPLVSARAGLLVAALVAAAAAPVRPVVAQQPAVTIAGDVPQPYQLTPDVFAALEPVELIAGEHGGEPHRYRGVPLRAILERAGVGFGAALRGPRLATYVLVEAADAYQVVFALASLDETFGGPGPHLVDAMDGQPLAVEQGPYRVVVPGDGRPARWARQVVRILVVQPAPAPPGAPR